MRLLSTAILALGLVSQPASAVDLSAMDDAERAAFGEAVRAYLLENPQVIMEAVAVLEERNAQLQAQADTQLIADNADEIFDDGFSWVGGNPDGDVTVVEFLDYRCGFCKRAHPEVAKLLESDTNVRLIIKELPILGEASVLASRFAIATKQIAGDDAYKQVADALMAHQGTYSEVAFKRMANGFGLDGEAIVAQMDTPEVSEVIARTRALAETLAINGTPAFVVGGEMVRGFVPYEDMSLIVDDQRG